MLKLKVIIYLTGTPKTFKHLTTECCCFFVLPVLLFISPPLCVCRSVCVCVCVCVFILLLYHESNRASTVPKTQVLVLFLALLHRALSLLEQIKRFERWMFRSYNMSFGWLEFYSGVFFYSNWSISFKTRRVNFFNFGSTVNFLRN